jgi:hypothetical protein
MDYRDDDTKFSQEATRPSRTYRPVEGFRLTWPSPIGAFVTVSSWARNLSAEMRGGFLRSSDRSSQIPAAARMLGIDPPTCVQVAPVKIPRARRGRGARHGTPAAIGIGGINPSATVQVAPVIILAAGLGVGRADISHHRDHSYRQCGQQPENPNAHDVSPYRPVVGCRPNHLVCSFVPLPVCCQIASDLTDASPASAISGPGPNPGRADQLSRPWREC